MTEQEQIDAYVARRNANPMAWEEKTPSPVFDKGTFGETYDFNEERPNG